MSFQKIVGAEFHTDTLPPAFSMSVEGLEGTGKTHFSLLTTPPPIVHVNFGDRDATLFLYPDRMSEERREQTTLYSFHAASSEGWTRQEGYDSLAELSKIAREDLSNGKLAGGTFILDSASSWWEVVQECYVAPEQEKREAGGGKKTGGLEYMKGNLIVNGVIQWIKSQGAFVILTHRKAQEWGPSGPIPGKFKAKINSKVPSLVEVRLDLYKTCAAVSPEGRVCGSEECESKTHQGRVHNGRFLKFAANTGMEGFAFPEPSFGMVYSLYTGKEATW